MNREELLSTHALHRQFRERWVFYGAAYEGIEAMLATGILPQHPRESSDNYQHRRKKAIGFGYASSIVDLLTHYLFTRSGERELGGLSEHPLWGMFEQDVDLYGTDLETFYLQQHRQAAIFGHVGILIDMPQSEHILTLADQIGEKIYPYCSSYTPINILDWRHERDRWNRPSLTYLKLRDGDGRVRIWSKEQWQVWSVAEQGDPVLEASGHNPLQEIPFVWLMNELSPYRFIGYSDLRHVAPIEASIIRNLSQAEEVVDLAAFPMMRMPMLQPGRVQGGGDIAVGPRAILDFDPKDGEAGKPDWLDARVLEPIEAILRIVAQKAAEIYRATNTGGLRASGEGGGVKSGVALKAEFGRLNARLASKAANLEEAERSLYRYWLRWCGLDELFEAIVLRRPRNFDVEDLAYELATLVQTKQLVPSATFYRQVAKSAVRKQMSHLDGKTLQQIDDEIDATPFMMPKPSESEEKGVVACS